VKIIQDIEATRKCYPSGNRQYWHAYALQGLIPSKFSAAVKNIVHGKYLLISSQGKIVDYADSVSAETLTPQGQ